MKVLSFLKLIGHYVYTNEIIENSGKKMGHLDLRDGKNWNNFRKKFSFFI